MAKKIPKKLAADLIVERQSLVKVQRHVWQAAKAKLSAQRRLRASQKDLKARKQQLARLKAKGWATSRTKQTLQRRQGEVKEAMQHLAAAQRNSRTAQQKRRAQVKRVQKAIHKRDRQHQAAKVAAMRDRQSRVLKDSVYRERLHKACMEKKQQRELRALQVAQAAALKNLKERHSTALARLRQRSSKKLKELQSKQKEDVGTYKTWLASEESRHADQFKRCVGGSLGRSLCILRPKTGKHQFTLVYLHQFNCEGSGYAYFRPHYFYSATKFCFNGLKIVLPTANTIPITAHDGEEKHAWYDYMTDYDGIREDKVNMTSLRETRDRIFQILEHEIQLLGGDASKVFIGGASQGCCAALHCAMQFPRVLGGFVGVVGHLLSCTPVPTSKMRMPISLYNGHADNVMRWSWVRKTIRRFEDAGFTNLSLRCEPGIEHDTGIKEREWLIDFLSRHVTHPN
mmetsp:Transcript_98431/g.175297  ORF Transcript_98431/g.175297 Transcript_98431/m.175297 type:complete len:456 (+) Transcript_98431:56-1423(+)